MKILLLAYYSDVIMRILPSKETTYQMKLKQKRQIALTNFVNLIYTLDDCFQNNVEHILIKEAIDLEDENDPHISTVEHIYNSIYNVYYGFAITYNHLTKMLDAAIKFNEKYKPE